MKVYVIKNKDGEYWCGNNRFSTIIDIRKTYICEDFDFISKVINKLSSEGLLKDCTIVPITIYEGDLEEENRVLKAKLETAEYWNRKYDGLQEDYQVLKKALELACKQLRAVAFNYDTRDCDVSYRMAQFVQQAKESEKDE